MAGILAAQFLHQANEAKSDLEQAKTELTTLTTQVAAGDQQQVQTTADAITRHVRAASAIVDKPLWHAAAKVPFVGRNVDAVQRVTRAVDILVDKALPPGLHLMTTVDLKHLSVAGGGINLAPFRAAQASLPQISAAFTAASRQVAPIHTSGLMPQVTGPVNDILNIIHKTAPTLAAVDHYLPTLLNIAGGSGPQRYLVVFQNNAEIRATGGNPAASMVITVDNGRVRMGDQSNSRVVSTNTVYTNLPGQMTKLFPATFDMHSQDFTMTPDFPTAARLFEDLWAHTGGGRVDGVIAIDPVVLANLLGASGPVTLPGGEKITAGNAVTVLLSDAYARYPKGTESDKFFAAVAQSVFTHLMAAHWDPTAMLKALEQSVAEQRVYLNFTNPQAQALAVQLGVDGAVPSTTAQRTQLGMYLNNSSVSKLEYYLTTGVSLQCDPTARTVTETMTLHNSVQAGANLVPYVLGYRNPQFGIPRTTMMLDVVSVAPPGATIQHTQPAKGQVPQWERTGVINGNNAVSHTVFVPAGQTVTVSYTVRLLESDLGPLDLRYTPTAHATKVTVGAACGQLFPKVASADAAH